MPAARSRPATACPASQLSLDLGRSVLDLRGIGPARERQLAARGVSVLGDLLLHVPFRYEDRRRRSPVEGAVEGEAQTFRGRLRGVRVALRRGRRFTMVRGELSDDSGSIPVVWFNRPYLPSQIEEDEEYLLHGKVQRRGETLELLNPSCERWERAVHTGRVVPVYPSLGAIGPALMRRLLDGIFAEHLLAGEIDDPLPEELLERHALPTLDTALAALHLPDGTESVERLNRWQTSAHARLIYGDLLEFHLRLRLMRRRADDVAKGHEVVVDRSIQECLESLVPFELTAAQQRVVGEITADMTTTRPMRRLLQGDVGSGKTIVAAAALVVAMENGLQGAFMAPTELLAEQHYATFRGLLGQRYRMALLTGSSEDAGQVRAALAAGTVDLVVGTHALIQETVVFDRLGLAVIDEQHRFGVAQRQKLGGTSSNDLLVMTATPIPRSLTLTAYGDLDVSIVDELPPGRSPIVTQVLPQTAREEACTAVERELDDGGRAFVVFPAIERGEGGVPSLERGVERLRRRFPHLEIGVAHGRIPAEQRSEVMSRFERGELRLLAATTVIEVGVDVPEATVMVIEGAERFGLAQLHQLRGRVGRGPRAARCLALHGRLTEPAERRLEVFARTVDGFEIAEADLAIRGPGEVLGTRQAGMPRFRIADLGRDAEWVERARVDAAELSDSLGREDLADLIARLAWHPQDGPDDSGARRRGSEA